MTKEERLKLQIAACKVRMGVIESTHGAKAGHPGGSLSAADMFTYLYNKEMRIDPTNPKWEDRDRFVLSKGHTAPGLYSALAYRGFFPVEDLPTLRHIDSYLQVPAGAGRCFRQADLRREEGLPRNFHLQGWRCAVIFALMLWLPPHFLPKRVEPGTF